MANTIKLADRIKEISYVIGTGNVALNGAVAGFSSFASTYSDNDALFYAITDGNRYEVGSGVFKTGSQNFIIRFPFRSSSNNARVDFPEGVKEVYATYPATHSVYMGSGVGNLNAPVNKGVAFWASANTLDYDASLHWDKELNRLGINNNSPDYGIHVGGAGQSSMVKASGFIAGSSGIYFPPMNDGSNSYSGGFQLTHYEKNKLDNTALSEGKIGTLTGSSAVIELSGVANQYILFKPQGAGLVFAGPPSGCSPPCSPAYPTFRQLTLEDIPSVTSLSGILNNKMFTLIGTTNSNLITASGALNSKINAVSGVLSSNQGIPDGDKGDILVTSTGTVWTVDSSAITTNKIANSAITPAKISFANSLSSVCGGRLSLSTTMSNTTGSILYYLPYNGNSISLYNTSTLSWEVFDFSQISINLSGLVSSRNYDVFVFNDSGTLSLELSAWSSDSARTNNLTTQNGVYLLSSNLSRRYVGTVRTISTNSIADTESQRFVWNVNNRISRRINRASPSGPWTYNGTSWRSLSGTITSIELVCGLSSSLNGAIDLTAAVLFTAAQTSPTILYQLGVAKNTSTTPLISSRVQNYNDAANAYLQSRLVDNVDLGYHYYYPVEKTNGATISSYSMFGAAGDGYFGGIYGTWEC